MKKGLFATYLWQPLFGHYADFGNSMSRKAYWMFILLYWLAAAALTATAGCISAMLAVLAYCVWCFGTFLPVLAAAVRRLHDIGKSGWQILIGIIPLVGPIWVLVLLCKKGSAPALRTEWTAADTLHAIAAGAIVAGVLFSASSGEPKRAESCDKAQPVATSDNRRAKSGYYVFDDAEWTPNADCSRMLTVATTDERDIATAREGMLGQNGDLTIVAAEEPGGTLKPVLSASQILSKFRGEGSRADILLTPIPSSIDPGIIYFNYGFYGADDLGHCGKVDMRSGKFDLFDGTIAGMIEEGRFSDSYLRIDQRGDGMIVNIVPQSAIGGSDSPTANFNVEDHFPGHDDFELLFDDDFVAKVIDWVENQ